MVEIPQGPQPNDLGADRAIGLRAVRQLIANAGDAVLRVLLRPDQFAGIQWPGGRPFAFSIVDDTDQATLENVRPIYALLYELGLRTTKTVWVLRSNDASLRENSGESLADPAYAEFVAQLQQKGFEIASHGVRGGSSRRSEILGGMERYKSILGSYPRIHVNHAANRDNMYWGPNKLTSRGLRLLYKRLLKGAQFSGEDPASAYFWGDFVKEQISYVVDFSYHEINTMRVNPLLPYFDKERPLVNGWFHTSDGGTMKSLVRLLSTTNLDCLEKQGGACIVYTHFGKGACDRGEVNPHLEERLRDVARRGGWCVPASTLLDFVAQTRGGIQTISNRQRAYIQYRWVLEKMVFGSS